MGLNDNVRELKYSIGGVLVTITPEMHHQVMLSMRRLLQLYAQLGGQHFENLCKGREFTV